MRRSLLQYLARTPESLKRQALVQLFRASAAAYGRDMPRLSGLSREQCLREYARSTAEWTEDVLRREGDYAELQGRLYRSAYRLGQTPGWLLCVQSVEDVMTLGSFLYGLLDIEFQGSTDGEITISRCYFSSFYSAEVCQVMSSMDHGLLAGLAGRRSPVGTGELVFSQRITEGQACCCAHFTPAARPSSGRLPQEQER
jgi:hypothetical protein